MPESYKPKFMRATGSIRKYPKPNSEKALKAFACESASGCPIVTTEKDLHLFTIGFMLFCHGSNSNLDICTGCKLLESNGGVELKK